jgi:hypothetical protein
MGSLFSDGKTGRRTTESPPPPGPASSFFDDDPDAPPPPKPKKPAGVRFDAELDLCELDDRDRPGPTWVGRGRELSRAFLSLRSRRMCYPGRMIVAAVHLIDDRPVPLFGRVASCEYDGDGMYRTELELVHLSDRPAVNTWLAGIARRAASA